MARRFFFVSMGILALMVAYHLGAEPAGAQGSTFAGIAIGSQTTTAITTTGDVYTRRGFPDCGPAGPYWASICGDDAQWVYMGNVGGGPSPTKQNSWGKLKGAVGR